MPIRAVEGAAVCRLKAPLVLVAVVEWLSPHRVGGGLRKEVALEGIGLDRLLGDRQKVRDQVCLLEG
eukprot:5083007-Pyramimonas_sp.AAC.1